MGSVQLWTSILKFIPLVFMSTVGLFFISTGNFSPWNISGQSNVAAIGGAMALCLFSYLGVETAAVAAAKVRDPDRNVPRSTILGTLGTAVVYLLSLTAVFGIVPSATLGDSSAPLRDAVNEMFGGTWAGDPMAALVVISGFGALNGWTMICAEMPRAAEADGLFPAAFGRISKRRPGVRHHRLHRPRLDRDGLSTTWDPPARRCSPPWSSCPGSPPPSPTRSPRSPRSSGGSPTTVTCTPRGSPATSSSP